MKLYFTILFFVTLTSCNPGSPEPSAEVQLSTDKETPQKVIELRDTIRVNFKMDNKIYSPIILKSIIDKIVQKGVFKPNVVSNGNIDIRKDSVRELTIAYDSANMHFFIMIEYLLHNIHIESVGFSAQRSKKNPQYKPGFLFEEWTFNNNLDRDKAFNLIRYIYSHPKNIVMYEKRYTQLIKAENRLILLETGADIFEKYVIEYGNLIREFINSNYH
ncbi:MAG: hypothetical protein ACXWV9_01415 [Flavisolibacter sp.]